MGSRTITISGRVKPSDLATCVEWMHASGMPMPATRSDLVGTLVGVLAGLVRQRTGQPELSVADALTVLERHGLGLVNSDRSRRETMRALQQQVAIDELGGAAPTVVATVPKDVDDQLNILREALGTNGEEPTDGDFD